jgi:hypothetical protein
MTVVADGEETTSVRSWRRPSLAKTATWLADWWPGLVIAAGLALTVVWSVWLAWLAAAALGIVQS